MNELDKPFGPEEEQAIISYILDFPETYTLASEFITPNIFDSIAPKYVIAAIYEDFSKTGTVPSRALLHDRMKRKLTVDDPYEEILAVIKRPSNPREIPFIKDVIQKWVEQKTYSLLYSDEALEAHARGDYDYLKNIVESADKIKHSGQQGLWLFNQLDEIFAEESVEHYSTGFPSLDKVLNNGGPSPKEVLVWLAPTGVGKCLTGNTKIVDRKLSKLYEIEYSNGETVTLSGNLKVHTTRGLVRVCDLLPGDDVTYEHMSFLPYNLEITESGEVTFENKIDKADKSL